MDSLPESRTVSLVLTSCNRFDLLEKTLKSFFEFNTYPIAQHIIIEDSPNRDKLLRVLAKFPDIAFIALNNDPQLGQMKSIERAYSEVTSEFIFHCEDDWEFYRKGFVENSMAVLDHDEKISNVWLRGFEEIPESRFEKEVHTCKSAPVKFRYVYPTYTHPKNGITWYGFSLNPGLRRYSDYLLVKPISQFDRESAIGKAYYELGYKGAMLLDGYVRHIGYHRGIRYKANQPEWYKNFQVRWRKFKAKVLKTTRLD
ncbi:glycosyltransferase [Fulvivirga sedimenti]|uniref:Glycosyltransferase n=1 Tax=Fulvivirga sedimenti TaxID=2879465 RepID=A0A9X1KWM8_9BACT|nr:glycosyltransferase [Fulvivirga sedimenti]MCA6074119.1 glycosyltransferase [Fulvivirga sedimenti]